MAVPALAEVIQTYGHANGGEIAAAERELFQRYWLKDLIPFLVGAYPHIKRSGGRVAILARLLRWTRDRSDIVGLALSALSDRSYMVRETACEILAYSLRPDVVPNLQVASAHSDPKTKASALAAIDAIDHQNHHYFIDRQHTGLIRWAVKPSDE